MTKINRKLSTDLLIASIFFFLLSLWFYRYLSQKPILPEKSVPVEIEGEIVSLPYIKGRSQFFELGRVRIVSSPVPIRVEKIRVRVRTLPKFSYGDRLRLSGKLTPYSTTEFPEIKRIGEGGNRIQKVLFRVRAHLEGVISRSLPEPEAGLLSGILLGSKHSLSYDWEEVYKKVGLMHVVVASGYNITVLTHFLVAITRPLGMNLATLTAFLGVTIFVLMLGAEPPIMRAAIMGALTLWGGYLGRTKDALRALLFSALIMLLADPAIFDSLSFKLSFAASLGLILLATPLREKFSPMFLRFFGLDENFFSTVSASLFVFPIISYYFGKISLGSFLVNTLVLWTVPYAMIFGFLTTFFGLLSIEVSRVIGYFSWLLLRFFNLTASCFSNLPLVWEGKPSLFLILTYYSALIGLCLRFQISSRKKEEN